MKLFLDDKFNPTSIYNMTQNSIYENAIEWTIVRTYDEFISYIDKWGIPEIVSFDYDLKGKKTGLDCCKYLVEYCIKFNQLFPKYRIHSNMSNIKIEFEKYIQLVKG